MTIVLIAAGGTAWSENAAPKTVVVVGGGYAGLAAARELSPHVNVVVIDQNLHHGQIIRAVQHVADGNDIEIPFERLAWRYHFTFLPGRIASWDPRSQVVRLVSGKSVPYDAVIFATGSRAAMPDIPGLAQHAMPFRTLQEIKALRRAMVQAQTQARHQGRAARLVIIGSGSRGTELAAAVGEAVPGATIQLVARSPDLRLLGPHTTPRQQRYAERQPNRLGIRLRKSAQPTRVEANGVWIHPRNGGEDELIPADIVVAATGVETADTSLAPDAFLRVPGVPNAFVAGDAAGTDMVHVRDPTVMWSAQAAEQQGRLAALNVLREFAGRPLLPLHVRSAGQLNAVGSSAIGRVLGLPVRGRLAGALKRRIFKEHARYGLGHGVIAGVQQAGFSAFDITARSARGMHAFPMVRGSSSRSSWLRSRRARVLMRRWRGASTR